MSKPSFGLPSDVRVDILFVVMRVVGDPDANTLQDWLVQGAPLGMDRRIETTGVFPPADKPDKEDHSPTPDVSEQLTVGWEHHRSVLENPVDAHREFDRCRAAQIAVDIDKDTLERLFPKESPEKRKLRLVVDVRRSNANARAAVPERPILPRPRDIVADWEELSSGAASLGFTTNSGVSCENVTCDFRCILSCLAPRKTQELFGRGSSFPFWIRSKRCTHVSYGFWFERCTTHVVPYRGCSWKGCASNVYGRPLVRPCSRPNQHINQRPTPQFAWHTKRSETSSFEPRYSFGPQQGSKSLGQRGRGPMWPSGSVWSSYHIFKAIRSRFGSQPKLQMRSSRMRKNCWSHRCFL